MQNILINKLLKYKIVFIYVIYLYKIKADGNKFRLPRLIKLLLLPQLKLAKK
jgi:hypothetical protein